MIDRSFLQPVIDQPRQFPHLVRVMSRDIPSIVGVIGHGAHYDRLGDQLNPGNTAGL